MSNLSKTGSGVPTLDASNLACQYERVQIEFPTLTQDASGDIKRTKEATREVALPQNLAYLDDFYDKSTGTSGVAFRDKATGEVIVAYTGTNPNVQGFDGKIEYAKDIKLASLIEINRRI